MKKNLVYAMMLVAAMSSCSKDSDAPAIDNGNEPFEASEMPISLSASPRTIGVATKSYGTVGGVKDEDNNWNGETLYIHALKKNFGTTGDNTPDYTTYTYNLEGYDTAQELDEQIYIKNLAATAPATGSSNVITFNDGSTKYFPRKNAYDFFGYHIDDAFKVTGDEATPTPEVSGDQIVVPFKIDGTQDLMVAKAELNEEQKTALGAGKLYQAYSAASARLSWTDATSQSHESIQPIMQFKHLLTRLTFNVIAGNTGAENVYVRAIRVYSKTTGKLIAVYAGDAPASLINWEGNAKSVSLQEAPTVATGGGKGVLVALNNGLTDYTTQENYNNLPALKTNLSDENLGKYAASTEGTAIGEALLVEPIGLNSDAGHGYQIEIDVVQFYDNNGNKVPFANCTYTYGSQEAPQYIPMPTGDTAADGFVAGYSYDIKLTVYGLQDIQITAELAPWKEGGDIPMDPDNEF